MHLFGSEVYISYVHLFFRRCVTGFVTGQACFMDQSSGKKIVTHTYERKTDEMEGVLFSWAAEYEVNMRNIMNVVE